MKNKSQIFFLVNEEIYKHLNGGEKKEKWEKTDPKPLTTRELPQLQFKTLLTRLIGSTPKC